MAQVQPAYVIPLIVEQPTWGGQYIAGSKRLRSPLVDGKRIGQAFELFSGTWLTTAQPTSFAFATATDLAHPEYSDASQAKFSLQEMITADPVAVLGKKGSDRGWESMQVLIKFTQAQNNSYQVHVKPGKAFGKWQPKPESWYYLEKGKATLGLADPSKVEEYKARCLAIDQKAQSLSQQIKAGTKSLADAKSELQTFIDQDHPRRFVNTVAIEKDAVIDLSQGGTHHSWEVDASLPEGNIVYEVQVDVMDDFCTIRSFDQGNIKSDGSVRPLAIDDYFQALDLDATMNTPAHFLQNTPTIQDGANIRTLFQNQYYVTERLEFSGKYHGKYTTTDQSFHHIYALDGNIQIEIDHKTWNLEAGWSFFVPAAVPSYSLEVASGQGKVLITHL